MKKIHTNFTADSLKIKVDLLEPPEKSTMCRPLDLSHVEDMKMAIKNNPTKCTILIGCVNNATVAQITSGAVGVEVIGGNHTREAVQQLRRDACTPAELKKAIEFWPCKVYTGLSIKEKLHLGVAHNDLHTNSKNMQFPDHCFLFRQLWRDDKSESNWRNDIVAVLRLKVSMIFDFLAVEISPHDSITLSIIFKYSVDSYSQK